MKCSIDSASWVDHCIFLNKYGLVVEEVAYTTRYTSYDGIDHEEERYYYMIEMDSESEILKLIDKVGRIVVDKSKHDGCQYNITIYDGYLE